MKIHFLLAFALIAFKAFCANVTLMVDTNGTINAPTNFFRANTNKLSAALNGVNVTNIGLRSGTISGTFTNSSADTVIDGAPGGGGGVWPRSFTFQNFNYIQNSQANSINWYGKNDATISGGNLYLTTYTNLIFNTPEIASFSLTTNAVPVLVDPVNGYVKFVPLEQLQLGTTITSGKIIGKSSIANTIVSGTVSVTDVASAAALTTVSNTAASAAQKSANLSDLASAATAKSNLGLAAIASSGSASDLTSGTLPAARLPNPSATTLGGVQSVAAVTSRFLTSISTAGVPVVAQPAASDVTGLAASATTDTTQAGNISGGTLPSARLPAFTGDITTSAGSVATTLAISGVTAASYGSASAVPVITFDAKGRATTASTATITPSAIGAASAADLTTVSNTAVVNTSAIAIRTRQAYNMSALLALDATTIPTNSLIEMAGYYSAADGGEGTFALVTALTVGNTNGYGLAAPALNTSYFWKRLNADPLNVRWFGAYGDYSHDDTAAIGYALGQIQLLSQESRGVTDPNTNANVYFPSGHYIVSGTNRIKNGHHIFGASKDSSVIRATTQANVFGGSITNSATGITIHDLGFTGTLNTPNYTNTAGWAIWIAGPAEANNIATGGGARYTIRDIKINAMFGGIRLSYAEAGSIRDCQINDCSGIGISITGGSLYASAGFSAVVDFSLFNNEVVRCGSGFGIDHGSGINLIGNTAIACRTNGFMLTNNVALMMTGNSAEYNWRALVLDAHSANSIVGNYFNCSTYSGNPTIDTNHICIGYGTALDFSRNYITKTGVEDVRAIAVYGGSIQGRMSGNRYAGSWVAPLRTFYSGGYAASVVEEQETSSVAASSGFMSGGGITVPTSSSLYGVGLAFKDPYGLITAPAQPGIEMAYGALYFNSSASAASRHAIDMTQIITNTSTAGTAFTYWYNGNVIIFPNALTADLTFTPSTGSMVTGANGLRYTIRREGLGGYNLNIPHADGTLALTTTNQWAEIAWNGGTWKLLRDNVTPPVIFTGNFRAAGTAPTCTGATIGTGAKNNAGFVTSITGGVTTCVITFSVSAPTGWAIAPQNNTTANLIRQTGSTTTTATFMGTTLIGDVLSYIAMPY